MKRDVLTADDGQMPAAVPTFQRPTPTRLFYGPWQWVVDGRHGRRDQKVVARLADAADGGPYVLDTVYLQHLSRLCDGHLTVEHLQTTAMISALDDRLVAAGTALSQALADAARRSSEGLDPSQVEVDGEEAARARRTRAIAAANTTAGHARTQVRQLLQQREAHWTALLRRAAEVLAFFDQRATNYADTATRTLSGPVALVAVGRPQWLVDGPPPAPAVPDEELLDAAA